MSPRKIFRIRKKEKDPAVRDRLLLVILVERDGMSMSGAARHLGAAPVVGSQVVQSLSGRGQEGTADPPPLRKTAEGSEGDYGGDKETGNREGLRDG